MWKWMIALGVATALLCIWLGFSLSAKINEAADLRAEVTELEQKNDALVDAIQALGESNARANERTVRALENIGRIRNEPVTNGCGPTVHDSIERLRQQR